MPDEEVDVPIGSTFYRSAIEMSASRNICCPCSGKNLVLDHIVSALEAHEEETSERHWSALRMAVVIVTSSTKQEEVATTTVLVA